MRMAIGIDIGGTNTKFVLADEEGKVLSSHNSPTPSVTEKKPDKIVKGLINNLKKFIDKGSTNKSDIAGIGIGVAGLIDRSNGKVMQSPNISAINGVSLKDIFEKEFSLPVALENDGNVYAYGEKWVGTGKDFSNFAVLNSSL